MSFERQIEIRPAYDLTSDDPKKNFGVHGVEMHFVLKGERGAVSFLLFTNWMLPHVTQETDERTVAKAHRGEDISIDLRCFYHPMAADRGYHSPVPRYEGQEIHGPCSFLDGKPCYYDGSGLNAQVVYEALLTEGGEGVWKELEYYYHSALETPITERTMEGAELGVIVKAMTDAIEVPKSESLPEQPEKGEKP